MKVGKIQMKYKHTDGVRIEKDPETGLETVYPEEIDPTPAAPAGIKPDNKQQLQFMVEFIDTFKNHTDFNHLRDLVLFFTIPMIEKDPAAVQSLRDALEAAGEEEQRELVEVSHKEPEARLDDLEHNGYEILKKTLTELQTMTPEERQARFEAVYKKTTALEMINTKVANLLFDGKTDLTEQTGVRVGKIGKKDALVNVQAYVAIDGGMMPAGFSPYDREVLNGICSIYASGQNIMTTQTIYEAFTGRRNPSPQAKARVTRSINKMRTTLLSLDWTEHAKMNGLSLEAGDYIKTSETILLMQNIEAKINGTETNAFFLLKAPILYSYAKAVGQLLTIDKSLLQIDSLNNTDDSIVIKNYILRRIAAMKNPKNRVASHSILFESLFSDCGITGTKSEMLRKRNTVITILTELQTKQFITGFTVEKQGNRYKGVKIDFIPDAPQIEPPKKPGKNGNAG